MVAPATDRTFAFELGKLRCTVITDGSLQVPATFLFANAPAAEIEPLLEPYTADPGAIPAALNCLLVEHDGMRILWDTGTGGRWHPDLGQLAEGMAELGVAPESIDHVVLSHAHPDHIGGLLTDAGEIRYPNASYVMSTVEWEYWNDSASLEAMPDDWASVARLVLPPIADRLRTVDGETEIFAGVRTVPSPGHTPGHLALEVESDGQSLLCVGDAMDHPLSVENPNWLVATDGNPALTPKTRRELLARAVDRNSLFFANHFLFPALGHVERVGSSFVWRNGR